MSETFVEKLKKGARELGRDVEDFGNPPSTLEEVSRVVSDFWNDEVKPFAGKVSGEVKKELEEFSKAFEEFKKDPQKTFEDMGKLFSEQAEEFKNAISNSPILKKLGEFFKSVADLAVSVFKQDKVAESWNKFKDSATAVVTAVQETFASKGQSI